MTLCKVYLLLCNRVTLIIRSHNTSQGEGSFQSLSRLFSGYRGYDLHCRIMMMWQNGNSALTSMCQSILCVINHSWRCTSIAPTGHLATLCWSCEQQRSAVLAYS